jgi:hypothetical protein
VFVADPLEQLIHLYGDAYIDRIEKLAEDDKRFADLLGGVWHRDTVSDNVWSRIESVRGEPWSA